MKLLPSRRKFCEHHAPVYSVTSFKAGPGEIKRREVSWTLTKSWTIICGSGRDQEEGGGARSSREPRRDQEQGGGAGLGKLDNLLLQLFLDSCSKDIVFVTAPHSCRTSN